MDVPRLILRRTSGSSKRLPFAIGSGHRASPRRWIQISTLPGSNSQPDNLPINATSLEVEGPDARFEVLGAPYSLLSTSLSASQTLYTRRGTLVGLSGKAENVVSTISTLEPLRRAILGIPFFYQKITSATPVTALISTKSPLTSFTAIHLDGTVDWMVAQRSGLVAWTGQTLSITPIFNTQLSIGYWGNSRVTGRGLLALAGNGQIYELVLGAGESYVAHPSNVLAYTISKRRPLPYRFKSSTLHLQVPGLRGLAALLPDTRFFRALRQSDTWRLASKFWYTLRTWTRRTIFGDRLFLHFEGPTTILLQTRASRVSDVLSAREINEIADTPAGAVQDAINLDLNREKAEEERKNPPAPAPSRVTMAQVEKGGEVKFESPGAGP